MKMFEPVKRKLYDFWLETKLKFKALDAQGKFGVALLIVVMITNLVAIVQAGQLLGGVGFFLFEVACLLSALHLDAKAAIADKEALAIGLSLAIICGFWSLCVVVHPIATLALAFYFTFLLVLDHVKSEYLKMVKEMDQGVR
jgi:hypothetical protein